MYKISFLFAGQGSQFVGMNESLYRDYSIVRETFNEASEVSGIDLKRLCFQGPLRALSHTVNAHLAITTGGVALARVFMQEVGYSPQFCMGHSLGEYQALCCAGVLSFSDTIRLVKLRATLAEQATAETDGGMTVIEHMKTNDVLDLCREAQGQGKKIYLSSFTSKTQSTVSGKNADLIELEEKILERGGSVTPMVGSAPFHSPLMSEYAESLRIELARVTLGDFRYPVISNVTGYFVENPEQVRECLLNHLIMPVKWQQSLDLLNKYDVTLALEMGAKNVQTNILNETVPDIPVVCLGIKKEREALFRNYKEHAEYSRHIPSVLTRCMTAAVSTPNTNDNEEEYRIGAVANYERLKEIWQASVEAPDSIHQYISESLECLRLIFQTKRLPVEEQRFWFSKILDESGLTYQYGWYL